MISYILHQLPLFVSFVCKQQHIKVIKITHHFEVLNSLKSCKTLLLWTLTAFHTSSWLDKISKLNDLPLMFLSTEVSHDQSHL